MYRLSGVWAATSSRADRRLPATAGGGPICRSVAAACLPLRDGRRMPETRTDNQARR